MAPSPPSGLVTPPLTYAYASSASASTSTASSPRSAQRALAESHSSSSRPPSDEGDPFNSSNSDSYDSGGHPCFSEEDSLSSRVSSRVGSPVPPEAWEGYHPEALSYRAVSRRGSRHPSGTTTPTNADKEATGDCVYPGAFSVC